MKKTIVSVLCAGALSLGGMMTSQAAEIERLSVSFVNPAPVVGELQEPDLEVPSNGGYEIDDISWKNSPENWKPGKVQQVEISLIADEGNHFAGYSNKKRWSISGGEFVKCVGAGDGIRVTINYGPPRLLLDAPETAGWSREHIGTAKWSPVKNTSHYEIRLYQDSELKKTLRVQGSSYDFSNEIGNVTEWHYEVRAVPGDSAESNYLIAGEWVTSIDTEYLDDLGTTEGQWVNQNGMRYKMPDGSFLNNRWEHIVGSWYYFDAEGLRSTGWKSVQDKWYYLGEDGKMRTGWLALGGEWYFLNANGSMATGWCEGSPGKWYYLYDNGVMAKDTNIGNYYVDSSGLWIR